MDLRVLSLLVLAASASAQPDAAKQAQAMMLGAKVRLDFAVSVFTPMIPEPLHSVGHVAFDAENQYFDFGLKVAKGTFTEVEDLLLKEPEPPGLAESPAGIEDDLGLGGKTHDSLDVKVRLEKSSGLSASLDVKGAQKFPGPFCVVEPADKFSKDAAMLMQQAPPGFGVHDEAPHPNHMVKSEMRAARKDVRGESTSDLVDEAEDEMAQAMKPCNVNELEGDGVECLEWNVKTCMMAFASAFDAEMPPGAADEIPPLPQVKMYSNAAKDGLGKIRIYVPNGGQQALPPGTIWFNVTSLQTGDIKQDNGPVCHENQMSVEETMKMVQGSGAVPGPPSRRLQQTSMQAFSEGPVKLYALKKVSTLFRVMKVIAPKTRRLLPDDATKLMGPQERRAAEVNTGLIKLLKKARATPADSNVLVEMPEEGITMTKVVKTMSPALLLGAILVGFAAGVAIGRRSKTSRAVESDEQEELL